MQALALQGKGAEALAEEVVEVGGWVAGSCKPAAAGWASGRVAMGVLT